MSNEDITSIGHLVCRECSVLGSKHYAREQGHFQCLRNLDKAKHTIYGNYGSPLWKALINDNVLWFQNSYKSLTSYEYEYMMIYLLKRILLKHDQQMNVLEWLIKKGDIFYLSRVLKLNLQVESW